MKHAFSLRKTLWTSISAATILTACSTRPTLDTGAPSAVPPQTSPTAACLRATMKSQDGIVIKGDTDVEFSNYCAEGETSRRVQYYFESVEEMSPLNSGKYNHTLITTDYCVKDSLITRVHHSFSAAHRDLFAPFMKKIQRDLASRCGIDSQ